MKAGWNAGNHYTKVVLDGKEVSFPSFIAPGKDRELNNFKDTHEDDLDVHIINTDNGAEIWNFVGNLAKRYPSELKVAYEKIKATDEATKVCLLTATAFLAEKRNINIEPVVCLPIVDYRTQKDDLANNLKGLYTVRLPHKSIIIEISKVLVAPEGGCAAWDMFLDDKGNEVTAYQNKRIAFVDIGSRTTNVCVMENMAYVNELSGTYPIGMWNVYEEAAKEISKIQDVLPHQVEDYLHLVKDMNPYYKNSATALIKAIKMSYWKTNPRFDHIVLCGGSATSFLPYWQSAYHQTILHPRPQMANAWGAYKMALIAE